MKFSIIIPTQNRPELIAVAVYHALNQHYPNIELIVSDNSTSSDYKEQNRGKLEPYIQAGKVVLVSPKNELSAPEHFEFALKFATGDYVLYLTDKMLLLPNTLFLVAEAIKKSGAEIVNWTYFSFITDNYLEPEKTGHFTHSLKPLSIGYKTYDPLKHLESKASGYCSRTSESIESYVKGKICFGCYSKDLISRIVSKSGALYGGATHDYSAMIQALCLADKAIILDEPGVIFIALPLDRSWGTLTHFQSLYALKYYQTFSDAELILRSLLVPGLYSSSHNMVAHDYIKYLALYDRRKLFNQKCWLRSIGNDLYLSDKVWSNEVEMRAQHNLFFTYLNKNADAKIYYYYSRYCSKIVSFKNVVLASVKFFIKKTIVLLGALGQRILDMRRAESGYRVTERMSLENAVKLISSRHSSQE